VGGGDCADRVKFVLGLAPSLHLLDRLSLGTCMLYTQRNNLYK